MRSLASLPLRRISTRFCAALTALTMFVTTAGYAGAQIPMPPTPTTSTTPVYPISDLFVQSKAILTASDKSCDVESCHSSVAAALGEIANGNSLRDGHAFHGDAKAAWHARFGARIHDVKTEFERIQRQQEKAQPVMYRDGLKAPHCGTVMYANYNCDQVFNIGIALAATYALVCVACGIILALVTIDGYNNCIAANG